jgi:hypothetical protein
MGRRVPDGVETTHTLPQPQPPIDPAHEPFVGNVTVDDNLAEAAEVAVWNVLGRSDHRLDVGVDDGVVTLRGDVADHEQCRACERAVGAVKGVRRVESRIRVAVDSSSLNVAIAPRS